MNTSNDKRIVEAYLFFGGNCEKALEFYKKALNAEIGMVLRFKDSPEPPPPGVVPPGYENKIMHAVFKIGQTEIMASDGCSTEESAFKGFSLSIALEHEADADRYFNALSEGGKVQMPLNKTFWSPRFGMLEDKFGIAWMINVIPKDQTSFHSK